MRNNTDKRRWWKCDICHIQYVAIATSSAIEHLQCKHSINIHNESQSFSTISVLDQQGLGIEIQELQNISISFYLTFQDRLIRFITVCHASFDMITNEYFCGLFLCSTILQNENLPHISISHNTLRTGIENDFDKTKNKIKILLGNSRGKVHFSFDLWTSLNGLALNDIVVHFVDSEYKIQTILLDLQEIIDDHSGENIGQTVMDVVQKFQLESKLSTFVLDNAESNDIAVEQIIQTLDLQDIHEEEHVYLRCLDHIINLGVQEFIFGKNSDKWLREIDGFESATDIDTIQKSWISQGIIELLQNLISLIRSSP